MSNPLRSVVGVLTIAGGLYISYKLICTGLYHAVNRLIIYMGGPADTD